MIHIVPSTAGVPAVYIPNTVNAINSFSTSELTGHIYSTDTKSSLSGLSNLPFAGAGQAEHPTPGDFHAATPQGTLNDVGWLGPLPGPNYVKSFLVSSPDPSKYSDITVNYTMNFDAARTIDNPAGLVSGHWLSDGYVMQYSSLNEDNSITMHSYGEGNSAFQAFSDQNGPNQYAASQESALWTGIQGQADQIGVFDANAAGAGNSLPAFNADTFNNFNSFSNFDFGSGGNTDVNSSTDSTGY